MFGDGLISVDNTVVVIHDGLIHLLTKPESILLDDIDNGSVPLFGDIVLSLYGLSDRILVALSGQDATHLAQDFRDCAFVFVDSGPRGGNRLDPSLGDGIPDLELCIVSLQEVVRYGNNYTAYESRQE